METPGGLRRGFFFFKQRGGSGVHDAGVLMSRANHCRIVAAKACLRGNIFQETYVADSTSGFSLINPSPCFIYP
jgi:hypothetical protein